MMQKLTQSHNDILETVNALNRVFSFVRDVTAKAMAAMQEWSNRARASFSNALQRSMSFSADVQERGNSFTDQINNIDVFATTTFPALISNFTQEINNAMAYLLSHQNDPAAIVAASNHTVNSTLSALSTKVKTMSDKLSNAMSNFSAVQTSLMQYWADAVKRAANSSSNASSVLSTQSRKLIQSLVNITNAMDTAKSAVNIDGVSGSVTNTLDQAATSMQNAQLTAVTSQANRASATQFEASLNADNIQSLTDQSRTLLDNSQQLISSIDSVIQRNIDTRTSAADNARRNINNAQAAISQAIVNGLTNVTSQMTNHTDSMSGDGSNDLNGMLATAAMRDSLVNILASSRESQNHTITQLNAIGRATNMSIQTSKIQMQQVFQTTAISLNALMTVIARLSNTLLSYTNGLLAFISHVNALKLHPKTVLTNLTSNVTKPWPKLKSRLLTQDVSVATQGVVKSGISSSLTSITNKIADDIQRANDARR